MPTTKLVPVEKIADIFLEFRDSPIANLLCSHNLGVRMREYERPELLVCTCMDYRVKLDIPARYAFIIRTPGANLLDSEFGLATALSLGGIRAVAIIGHTDCAMTRITDDSEKFVAGLCKVGWDRDEARRYYDEHLEAQSISDPAKFVAWLCKSQSERFTNVLFAPLLYKVEDGKLYQVVG